MTALYQQLLFDLVIRTEDPDDEQMDKAFSDINTLLKKSHKDRTKSILLSVYFSGHGILDNTTKIVLNVEDPIFRFFDLESKLSSLSKLSNNFISVIFDCCREVLNNRGLEDADDRKNLTNQNLYITFGCPPRTGVPAKSTIVKSYIECVTQYLIKTNGVLELPAALDFRFKSKFEKSSTVRNDVTSPLYYDTTRNGQSEFTT